MNGLNNTHNSNNKPNAPYRYIYTHTALRGVAAFFVVAYQSTVWRTSLLINRVDDPFSQERVSYGRLIFYTKRIYY